ncbi:MAG: hypothetical protein U9Q73_00665 [Nanoarchaeota archaeon]|nr:hypothetical protein [Nanoarchaeota archaeon]
MDRKIAKTLVDELEKHGSLVTPDRKLFLNELVSAYIPESSKFYEVLPGEKQSVQESGRYHYLSLRRILRNGNAKDYQLSQGKKTYEAIASAFGAYSSDTLSRNLRSDGTLVEMMARCDEPFSLLGKFQSYDFDNPGGALFVVTRPVLVIPNAKDMKPIHDWEEANTTYEKEVGLFFRHPKRIKPQEYLSQ